MARKKNNNIDSEIEVRLYETEPTRRGYQISWNYEKMYWQALVGCRSFAAYETIRSFCHEGKDTCYPSLGLLVACLKLKDHRQLTGRIRARITQGEKDQYAEEGSLDVLQKYGLVITEAVGKGRKTRYIFHVKKELPQLTPDQVSQLPLILQRKHAQLLKRCEEAKKKWERQAQEKGKKPKQVRDQDPAASAESIGRRPIRYRTTSNKVSDVVQTNNTHTTLLIEQQHVVVALTNRKVHKRTAKKLARDYPVDKILEKIELHDYLLEHNPRQLEKNPAGFLIRAIEEDYTPPRGFKTKAEREAEAAERKRREEQILKQREAHRKATDWREVAISKYQISEELLETWAQTLDQLQYQMTRATFATWLEHTLLLSLDNQTALVGVQSNASKEWVVNRLYRPVQRTLAAVLRRKIALDFEVL